MEELLLTLIPEQTNQLILYLMIAFAMLWIKNLLESTVRGLGFIIGSTFNQGDHVYIEGEKAIIISVGMRRTIFEIEDGLGKTWLYVENTELSKRNIKKVIEPRELLILKRRRSDDKKDIINANNDN